MQEHDLINISNCMETYDAYLRSLHSSVLSMILWARICFVGGKVVKRLHECVVLRMGSGV